MPSRRKQAIRAGYFAPCDSFVNGRPISRFSRILAVPLLRHVLLLVLRSVSWQARGSADAPRRPLVRARPPGPCAPSTPCSSRSPRRAPGAACADDAFGHRLKAAVERVLVCVATAGLGGDASELRLVGRLQLRVDNVAIYRFGRPAPTLRVRPAIRARPASGYRQARRASLADVACHELAHALVHPERRDEGATVPNDTERHSHSLGGPQRGQIGGLDHLAA
jgi:hypothetical protein